MEIERFQRDRTVLDVIKFVELNSALDDASWQPIKSAVQANPTILRRFLDSKIGKRWLGSSTQTDDDGTKSPAFGRDPEFVLSVLEQLFRDIASKAVNTRTYNKAEDIEGYFESLPKALHPPKDGGGNPVLFRDAIVKDGKKRPRQDGTKPSASTAAPAAAKTTKPKGPRVTLAEKRHHFQQPGTVKGQRLVYEASRLNVKDYPLASAFILRAFLEHTIDSYMAANTIPRFDKNKPIELAARATKVIDHIVQNSSNKSTAAQSLRGVGRVLTNTKDPASIQALNDYHHDRYQLPPADALQNAWDASVPLFVAVWGEAQ